MFHQGRLVFISAACISILSFLFLPAVTRAQEPLVLGIHPFLSSTEIYKRFTPLTEHLSRKLGRPVNIHLARSYDSHVSMVGTGKVDIAFMGPASYVKLKNLQGKVPLLAAFETKSGKTFKGVIVVRKDSSIKTLAQLRGKKFAFGDVDSTMSHLVPRFMLLRVGINLKDLRKTEFLTNHENIVLGVLSGSFDAGAIKDDIFNLYEQQGLRKLAISEPMPDHLFVARKGLPDGTVRKISAILQSLKDTEQGRQVLRSIQNNLTALVPAKDADYDPLRTVLDSLAQAGVKP